MQHHRPCEGNSQVEIDGKYDLLKQHIVEKEILKDEIVEIKCVACWVSWIADLIEHVDCSQERLQIIINA
jgi:hypothetical protein